MTALETLQSELNKSSQILADLNQRLANAEKFKEKVNLRNAIFKENQRYKKILKDIKKLQKSSDKTTTNLAGFEAGFNPVADRLNGVAGIVTAGGSAVANMVTNGLIGASALIGAKGDATAQNTIADKWDGTGLPPTQGNNNMMYLVLAFLAILFLRK